MPDDSGFIALWRSILKWEWYDSPATKAVFLHLLLTANYTEKAWRGQTIKPGQLITSAEKMAKELGLTRQIVRTSLERLKSTGEITIRATNKFTLVTVENWASYNGDDKKSTNRATNSVTIKQPTDNQQITTTNKDNKEIKKEGIYIQVKNLWNENLFDLPKVTQLSKQRMSAINARLSDGNTLDDFQKVFLMVKQSDFLSGRTEKAWKCNFDWVLNPTNWIKIKEGNYVNREKPKQLNPYEREL